MIANQSGSAYVRRDIRTTLSRFAAWTAVPLYLLTIAISRVFEYRLGAPLLSEDLGLFIGFGAFALVGSLLVARRPQNWVSWIMVSIGLIVAVFPAAESYAAYRMLTTGEPNALAVFGVWANEIYWIPLLALAFIYLPLLFPDGKLLSPRWRWPAGFVASVGAFSVILAAVRPLLQGQDFAYSIVNPIGVAGAPGAETGLAGGLIGIGLLVGVACGAASVILRYRRANAVEREQLKWFLFAVALVVVSPAADYIPILGDLWFSLALIAIPTAVGVAILRYHLYDIDLIIRKTLQYGVLTAVLALVYFGVVVSMQALFVRLTGSESAVAIVLSTLTVAALFAPLRSRVQAAIDQRFFRSKYDLQKVLADFSQAVRDEVDVEQLKAQLEAAIVETMQPSSVAVWVNEEGIGDN